jgi:prepilin-type N-terminal cleavage/methylation domain-containing protein
MKNFIWKRGFTLVELMVVSVVILILLSSLYRIILGGISASQTGLTYIEISHEARLGIERMIRELREAQSSTVSIPEEGRIEFKVPKNSNVISYFVGGDDGKQLIRSEGGSEQVLCNNVEVLQFTLLNEDLLEIRLMISKTSPSQRNLNVSSRHWIKLRN